MLEINIVNIFLKITNNINLISHNLCIIIYNICGNYFGLFIIKEIYASCIVQQYKRYYYFSFCISGISLFT